MIVLLLSLVALFVSTVYHAMLGTPIEAAISGFGSGVWLMIYVGYSIK